MWISDLRARMLWMLWLRMLPQPGMADHKHSRGHLKVLSGGISSTISAPQVAAP